MLRSSNKNVALQKRSIYYTWKNRRQQRKNNKLKIIAPTWNDEFDFPNGFYSMLDIQDYIECVIEKYEIPSANHLIHIYIKKINNRLVFKIKDRHKLELQTAETMKLIGSTKTLVNKIKNGRNVLSLEVVEVVLVQCNLVDNQYH